MLIYWVLEGNLAGDFWADLRLDFVPKPIDGARLAVGRFPAKLGPTTHEIGNARTCTSIEHGVVLV